MDEHIQIGDVAPRAQYVADGTQTDFTFPFPIFDAGDLEVRAGALVLNAGFAVDGAGESAGGTCRFAEAPLAGTRITLRRVLPVSRTTDFQENGILRARTLNDELDYQVAALQEVRENLSTTLRTDPSEVGGLAALPARSARANKLLGFDSVGAVTVFERGDATLTVPFPNGVPRTVEDKLAERLSARDFGAVGDGATDDGPALQAAMNAAAVSGKFLDIGEGTFRTTMALTLPGAAAGLAMRGRILYAGPPRRAALTIGDAGNANNQRKSYTGIAIVRATQSDWSDERDVGVRFYNLDACDVEVLLAFGFTIGVQLVGDGRGCEDSDLTYGRITNNRIGVDLRTLTAASWMNSLRHYGGHFASASAVNPTQARYGFRFSAVAGAYDRHNAHLFTGPAFELQRQGTPGTVDAIPFLIEAGDSRGIRANGVRMEACSPIVARHFGGVNDAIYEVAYVGTYGFAGCAVDYAPGATRAGGSVVALHQAAASENSPRLIADAGHLRSRAFRWSGLDGGEVGFDGMAVLSGNPAGAPTTLDRLLFAGLSDLGLNADSVTLPTSRAVAFVVDAGECREFFIAAEGTALRPVVQQYDPAGTVLGGGARVLLSNMNILWPGTAAQWWEGNADLDSLIGGVALNRLQRVTLAPEAAFAVIGVRGGVAGATLKALRLYCGARFAPPVLAARPPSGGPSGPTGWGMRELTASAAWDPPSIAAGGTTTLDVAVDRTAPGDFVDAAFSRATTLPLEADMSATGVIRARFSNPTGAPVDLAAGTLFVRALKPRL